MARIDLDLAHAYRARTRREDSDYALLPLRDELPRRRRLCAARALGLRQDHDAQHHLGPAGAVAGQRSSSTAATSTHATPQQRNIAQVFQFPVIYDTMTVRARTSPSRCATASVPAEQIRKRVGEIAEMLDMSGQLNQRAAGLAADAKQKISLGRGLVRSDVVGRAVRRAADRDRPAPQVAAAAQAQADPPRAQAHADLRHARPGRGADLRRRGGGDDARQARCRSAAPRRCSSGPAHTFVGHFIGSPGMNFLPAISAGGMLERRGHGRWRCRPRALPRGRAQAGRPPRVRRAGRARRAGARAGDADAAAGRGHPPDADRAGRRAAR